MLNTKGDTAVYLMFAYARLVSILRKGQEEKGFDPSSLANNAAVAQLITLEHPAERILAFELLQFGEIVRSAVADLLPCRVCEFLKEVCEKFTSFVTNCHVLNSKETMSRLLLCEATRKTMAICFSLLGIQPLDRI